MCVLLARRIHSEGRLEKCISGLATRNNTLYVGRSRLPLEIYDATTFRPQRRLHVAGLKCIFDMASCPDCDVVYVADHCRNTIHVIDDDGPRAR